MRLTTAQSQASPVQIGTVQWFSNSKGYGFIRGHDGVERFFHVTDLAGDFIPDRGMPVFFQSKQDGKGPRAVGVVLNPTYGCNKPFRRALSVWFVIIIVETIHGIIRQSLIVPMLGDLQARQVGVFVGSILILAVVWFFGDWLNAKSLRSKILIGLFWCVLTFTFEVVLGFALGFSLQRVLSDYDLNQGGLMIFGMTIMAFSLVIVSKFRTH